MSIPMLNQYVANGYLSADVADSLKKYGEDKVEDAAQEAVLASLQGLNPRAAARRAVEPEFSTGKLNQINQFYLQIAGEYTPDRLADTAAIAAGLGVGQRRAQQILKITIGRLQDDRQPQLFGSGAASAR